MIADLDIAAIKIDDGEFTFIFATAAKQKVGGFRRKDSSSYLTTEKISNRIIEAYFAGIPMVTIIAADSSAEVTTVNSREGFFNNLSKTVESKPPNNVIIVLGSFNARIRDSSHKKYS